MKRRVLDLLLGLYPRNWRKRYTKEVADLTHELLEQREINPLRVAIDLAMSALFVRGRTLNRRHRSVLVAGCAVVVAIGAVTVIATEESPTPSPLGDALVGRAQMGDLHLARGQSSAHFTITAISPPIHAYNVLVETAASANLSVHFLTWYGKYLGVQYSTQGTLGANCTVTGTRMTCPSHFPELGAERGGHWKVIASKRTGPPVSVRIIVTFQSAAIDHVRLATSGVCSHSCTLLGSKWRT